VIPYGAPVIENAPVSVLSEYGLKPHDYYLVVCRMEPENHVLEILQGFTASSSSHRLIIIGNHLTDMAYVRKLKLISDNRIAFVSAVYDWKKLSTLRFYSCAYIHGHSVGGTNPSLLEALGCGNLVIAHDNVFNREVAGEIGVYFRTSDDITRCVEKVDVMGAGDRDMLSAAAKKRILECYNWDIITDQYSKIFH
jgi:glycosyltransferase involved in cell wall biosynthesis